MRKFILPYSGILMLTRAILFLSAAVFLPVSAAFADPLLTKTINGYERVAVDATKNTIYAANSAGPTTNFAIINGASNEVSDTIANLRAAAVVVNTATNRIYLSAEDPDSGTYKLATVDAVTKTVTFTNIASNVSSDLAVNSSTNRVYLTRPDGLVIVDGATNEQLARVTTDLSGATSIGRVAVNTPIDRVYVTNAQRGTLSIFNGSATSVIRVNVATPNAGAEILDVAANEQNNTVAVTDELGRTLSVYNGFNGALVAKVTLPIEPKAVAINQSTNQIYVGGNGILTSYYADSLVSRSTINLDADFISEIGINSITKTLYVTGFKSGVGGRLFIVSDDFTGDTTAPTVSFTSPVNGAKLTTFPAITGTVQDNVGGTGIQRVALFIKRSSDGKYFSGRNWSTAPVELPSRLDGSTFTPDFALPEGVNLRADTYFVTAVAIDRAQPRPNRRSVTASIRIIDTTAPQIVFAYPSDGQQLSQLTKISGMLTDNEGGVGPARVLVQIRRVSDGKYFDGTRWTVDAVALSARLIGSGRAVAWELAGALPPAESRNDIYRITAVGFDRSFNRSVAQTIEVRVGTVTTGT